MAEIVKPDGSTVLAGELIARLNTDAKATAAKAAPAPASAAATSASAKGAIAMPAAAKMMADAGMSRSQVAGTGKDGRITKGDVLGAAEAKATGRAGSYATRGAARVARRQGATSTFPSSSIGRNSVFRCRGCVSAWQSVWCNRSRRRQS